MTDEPIFESEWREYEWDEVREVGSNKRRYIRGKKIIPPPVDGYHYERVDTYMDKQYIWERVYQVRR